MVFVPGKLRFPLSVTPNFFMNDSPNDPYRCIWENSSVSGILSLSLVHKELSVLPLVCWDLFLTDTLMILIVYYKDCFFYTIVQYAPLGPVLHSGQIFFNEVSSLYSISSRK